MNTQTNVGVKEKTIQERKVWFVLILGSLTAFGPLSLDMYLPALPAVTTDLNTTASLAQLSITTCLLGLATGQLILGPLSDMHGRRKPLIITLVLYTIFSLLAGLSGNIWLFVVLRFFQGFTGAAGIVIARASARDMYIGKDLTRFIALLAIVNGAAPILAPVFGGIILKWLTWQAIFYILAIIGLIMFLAVLLFLPETLTTEKRMERNMFAAFSSFGTLFKDRTFLGIAFSQAFIMMGMFAYIAASPFVLQNIYNVSPQQFSFIFAMNGVGIILSAQIAGKLAHRFSEMALLKTSIIIAFLGSILLMIVVLFDLPLWIIMIALFSIVSTVGIVNTTGFSLAMNRQGEVAGSASAFLGILPFAGGALVSPLAGIAGEHNAIPMGAVIFICCFLALLSYGWMMQKKKS